MAQYSPMSSSKGPFRGNLGFPISALEPFEGDLGFPRNSRATAGRPNSAPWSAGASKPGGQLSENVYVCIYIYVYVYRDIHSICVHT